MEPAMEPGFEPRNLNPFLANMQKYLLVISYLRKKTHIIHRCTPQGTQCSTINMEWMNEWMNEHDQTSLSHLMTNPRDNGHKLLLTVLLLTSLYVPSGVPSNSKYKLNFILERHWNFTEQLLLPSFSPVRSPLLFLLLCWLPLLHQQPPPHRGLEIKLELPRNGALIASSSPLPPPNPAGTILLC